MTDGPPSAPATADRTGRLLRMAARIAVGSEAPVFVAVGRGGREAAAALRLDRRLRVVDSPRHAILLLVAGALPVRLLRPLLRTHDQMPHPRATLLWEGGAWEGDAGDARELARLERFLPGASRIEGGADPGAVGG